MTADRSSPPTPALGGEVLTLAEVIRANALAQPEARAFTFLEDGEGAERTLTYEELDRGARGVARALRAVASPGDRALLLYLPGLDFIAAFAGCLYAGVTAVPVSPPERARSFSRLRAIVADAGATVALTDRDSAAAGTALGKRPGMHVLETMGLRAGHEGGSDRSPASPADVAMLQYTSGSTRAPRGVMVTHGNLMRNQELIHRAFGTSRHSIVLSWLPFYHDMGLIGSLLHPLYLGAQCILMSPFSFLRDPIRWLRAISRYRATTSGGPNFAYELCRRRVSPGERGTLDLSCWDVAYNGAEPIRASTLQGFAETFAASGFRYEAFHPCYGLAEATLMATAGTVGKRPVMRECDVGALESEGRLSEPPAGRRRRTLVGSGRPFVRRLAIVDARRRELPEGAVGEIWVADESVCSGYVNRPRESARVFRARLATGERSFLRTGDLGFVENGELFVTGRLKELIILRGRNYYPQDIEFTVEESHPALRAGCCAAFSVDVDGEERLIVVQELKRGHEPGSGIVRAIRQGVSDAHQLQVHAVVLVSHGTIPKTPSNKIQRRACRAAFLDGSLDAVAVDVVDGAQPAAGDAAFTSQALEGDPRERRSLLERELGRRVARQLGVEPTDLGRDTPLTALGLDSLIALELQHELERDFGVELPPASLLEGPTLAELADRLLTGLTTDEPRQRIPVASGPGSYPLSRGQQALWFLHQLTPGNPAYTISRALRIRGRLDTGHLRDAFQTLVDRHPTLRTTYGIRHGVPVQIVHERSEVAFAEEDASSWPPAELQARLLEEAHRPFDLERGPLLRVTLFERSPADHVLMLGVHHIAVDFWSLAVLLEELSLLSARVDGQAGLPEPGPAYADFTRWEEEMLDGPEGRRLAGYWQDLLEGELPTLELPSDRPRPPAQTYNGASLRLALGLDLSRRLQGAAREHGVTLYTLLLSAYSVLLHRYTGQDDVLIGTPTAGRVPQEFSRVVGYFVNPVIVRADLSGDPTFAQLVRRMRERILGALQHRAYPFSVLVERLQPVRDRSRSPLFGALFTLQKAHIFDRDGLTAMALLAPGAQLRLGPLLLESVELEDRVTQFDLDLAMGEVNGELIGVVKFNTDLFERSSIDRMFRHFQTLLAEIADDGDRRISTLPLLSADERDELLALNAPAAEYRRDVRLHELFEASARRSPARTALVHGEGSVSFAELDDEAGRLASLIAAIGRSAGATRAPVGALAGPSPSLVAAILAAFKVGSAIVPLRPEDPDERLGFVVRDSGVHVLVTERSHLDQALWLAELAECVEHVVVVDADAELAHDTTAAVHDRSDVRRHEPYQDGGRVPADAVAYIVYTSGTTGRPKGVPISHCNVVPLLLWQQRQFHLGEDVRAIQTLPPTFDFGLQEVFTSVFFGGTLVIPDGGQLRYPPGYVSFAVAQKITMMYLTPSYCEEIVIVGERIPSLRTVLIGGEILSKRTVAALRRLVGDDCAIFNGYGPTEASINCAMFRAGARSFEDLGSLSVPVGRASGNSTIYVLDGNLDPVPLGVPGELYIGGPGVAAGYLNQPALTAENYVPDPFGGEPGGRLYRTGDIGRYLASGDIEVLGRRDDQVKIRGFRIELGESRSALLELEDVRDCAVIVRDDMPGGRQLVAYAVPADGAPLAAPRLQRFLRQRLPDYMVPGSFVFLEALPLMPSGKLDRRALPRPQPPVTGTLAPRTRLEALIAETWRDALGVEQVALDDSFFELGGHSLLAARVHARLGELLGRELAVHTLFEYPTVRSFARFLTEGGDDVSLRQSDRRRRVRERQRHRQRALRRNRER